MRLKPACWFFAAMYLPAAIFSSLHAEELPFQGQVNSDNINIRSDSTVSAEIICSVNRDQRLEVIQELYGWYKVRLPKFCPAYIKKNMVKCAEFKTPDYPLSSSAGRNICTAVKIIKEGVNIRLKPDEASPIIGRANKNEILSLIKEKGEWYGIEPGQDSFGWIHKKFIKRIPVTSR
jgi:uncharacterized protein YgiM (DUF1202 family)